MRPTMSTGGKTVCMTPEARGLLGPNTGNSPALFLDGRDNCASAAAKTAEGTRRLDSCMNFTGSIINKRLRVKGETYPPLSHTQTGLFCPITDDYSCEPPPPPPRKKFI